MRKYLVLLITVVVPFLATPVLFAHFDNEPSMQKVSKIGGQVTDSLTDAPLENIEVTVYDSDYTAIDTAFTRTDESGNYLITGLPAGEYLLGFAPNQYNEFLHYQSQYYNGKTNILEADRLILEASTIVTDINIALTPQGSIVGNVTELASNAPISELSVSAYDWDGNTVASSRTDADGNYSLLGLDTGDYWIYFGALQYQTPSPYIGTHYPEMVSVTAPNATPNINATLQLGGQISGLVMDKTSRQPVESVDVFIYDRDGREVANIETDEEGVYTVTGLEIGEYAVQINSPNFPAFHQQKPSLADADFISIEASTAVANIDFSMDLGSTITGTIVDSDTNAPLEGVSVRVYNEQYHRVASVHSKEDGNYVVGGLPEGDYKLRYTYNRDNVYSQVYYPDAADLASATAVAIAANSVKNNVDVSMPFPARNATISGQVTAEDTELPLADVGVTLYDERDSDGYLDTVSTDSSGNFTFERLGEGTYYLRFSPDARNNTENYLPEYYNDQRLLSEAAGIDVAQDTNAVANASLSIGGQITGTVVALESGLPLDVSLRLYDSEDNRVASANTYRNNGVFEFDGLPTGEYRIYVDGSGTDYVSTYYGGADLQNATVINVAAGQTTGDIALSTTTGARISGQVLDASDGERVRSGNIYVVDTSGSLDDSDVDYVRVRNGAYETDALPDGQYQLRFAGSNSSYEQIKYLPLDYPTPVTIADGNSVSGINFFLQKGASIVGRLVDADSQQPLNDIKVVLGDCTQNYSTTFTDEFGLYSFYGLTAGTYPLHYENNLNSQSYRPHYILPQPSTESLTVQEQLIRNHALSKGGQLVGVVTAIETGLPLQDIDIDIRTVDGDRISYSSTNEGGGYHISGLPAGEYVIEFAPDNYGAGTSVYYRKFYNDKTDIDAAEIVQLSNNERIPSLNGVLSAGSRLAGLVVDANNSTPLADININVLDEDGRTLAYAMTDTNGRYLSAGLSDGSYRIKFLPDADDTNAQYAFNYFSNGSLFSIAEQVPVTGNAVIAGIDASMQLGSRISGQITNEAGESFNNVYVSVIDSENKFAVSGLVENETGTYITAGLPQGSYRLGYSDYNYESSCQTSSSTVEFYNNKADLENADAVSVNGVDPVTDINIVLDGVTSDVASTPTPVATSTPEPPSGTDPTVTPTPSQPDGAEATPTPIPTLSDSEVKSKVYLPAVQQ